MWITRPALLVFALSGCSLIGIRGAPRAPSEKGDPPVECVVHPILPAVDGTVGTIAVLLGAGVAVADLGAGGNADEKGAATALIGLPLILLGAVEAGSALYGSHENTLCRAARRDQEVVDSGATSRYFCSTSADESVGSCSLVPASCELARSVYAEAHVMSKCSLQVTAACVDYHAPDGTPHSSCAPSPDTCEVIRRNIARKNPDVGGCVDRH
jgi:hypothetical protein